MLHTRSSISSSHLLAMLAKHRWPGLMLSLTLLVSLLVPALALTINAAASSPGVTVDKNIVYQQIEGFGSFGDKYPDYFGFTGSQRWPDDFLTYYVQDLGASINRQAINPAYNPARGQYDSSVLKDQVDYIKALQAKASSLGLPPLKIIMSPWSPPAWMKQNNSLVGTDKSTNRLKDDDQTRQDFANFLVHYLQDIKSLSGSDVYAVSLQNEPELALNYNSTYYTGPDLAKVLAAVGPALQQANLSTKILYPEDVSNLGMLSDYLNSAIQNPNAKPYLTNFTVHGYSSNGVDPNSDTEAFWKNIYTMASAYNLPTWMTETSNYPSDWNGAFTLGRDIYSSLKYGKLSAWLWWTNTNWDNPGEGLMDGGTFPSTRSAASTHFYRFIRPGAVMVDATSSDPNVLSVAFNDSARHTMTIVLLNPTGSGKDVPLNFSGQNIPAQWTAYRSSSSERVANVGTVTSSVNLPANSIVTLTGTFSGNDATQGPTIAQSPQSQTVSPGQQVTLNVLHGGTSPFTYQWQRNGTDIPGAIGPQYTFTATNDANGAQYRVRVKNAYGEVTSQSATITLGSFTGASAPYSSSSIGTDGSSAIWNTAPSYSITHSTGGTPTDGFSGSFQTAWDNEKFYVYVKVNDSNYTNNSDAVEVYVDGNNKKQVSYGSTDWQIALDQKTYSMAIYQNGTRQNPATFPNYGQVGGSGGYGQVVAIPWSILGQTPTTGGFVGLDVAIIQGSSNSKLFWHSTVNNNWSNPGLFGTVQLSNGSNPGTNPTPTPTATPTQGTTPTPTPTPTPTQPPTGSSLPNPWQHGDIGSVNATGSASYTGGTFSVAGSGQDIGGNADSFHYVYQSLSGNGTIVARVASMDAPNGYARSGLMIREALTAGSPFAFVGENACCGSVTIARSTSGGGTSWNPTGSGSVPYWLKLVRSGSTFTAYTSPDGSNWIQVDSQTITMGSNVYIGLAVTSYSNGLLEHTTFDNVTVS